MNESEKHLQRSYYAKTASIYDDMHLSGDPEHMLALTFLLGCLKLYNIQSVLDVGSGTGRVVLFIKENMPHIRVVGVEPVAELRNQGYAKGLSRDELIDGDANNLGFNANEFDLVCEFAMLHHLPQPQRAISEMLRVAKSAIFISDSNNFGQGSSFARSVKQILNSLHLWRVANWVKTRGKGYTITEGDGLAYSYSVFSNFSLIRQHCSIIHLLNTKGNGMNLYRSAPHIALFGLKASGL